MKELDRGHQFGSVRCRCYAEVVQFCLIHAFKRLEILVSIQYEDGNVILKQRCQT